MLGPSAWDMMNDEVEIPPLLGVVVSFSWIYNVWWSELVSVG